jgi:nicotinamidase-related amidase
MVVESLDPRHTCLLFFDTSKLFVNGPTLKAEDRRHDDVVAVANWQRQLALARELNMMIAYAHTAQRADQSNYYPRLLDLDENLQPYPDGMRRPMSRAVFGTEAVQVIDEIAPRPEDYMIWKERWDPWHQTTFELSLRRRNIDTIIVNGGATEIGIAATAYGAHRLDFDVVFVADGCTSRYADCQEIFMKSVFPRIGRVRTTDQVLAMLRAGAGQG